MRTSVPSLTRAATLAVIAVIAAGAVVAAGPAVTAPATASPAPSPAAGRVDGWNTFSVDVTIRHSRVTADGKPTGEVPSVVQYRWERRLTASGWHTTMTLIGATRPSVQSISGPRQLDNPFTISRIEDDEDGTPLRMFDRNGEELRPPSASTAAAGNPLTGQADLRSSSDVALPGGGVRPMTFGRDWIESVIASPLKSANRRTALERQHGKAVGRVGGLDRFLTTRGEETVEVLADSQTALPVEINTVRSGALVAHTTVGYAAGGGGSLVRRSVRTEHALPGPDGERAVTDVEFANVRLEERR